jgi:hypothetical protein
MRIEVWVLAVCWACFTLAVVYVVAHHTWSYRRRRRIMEACITGAKVALRNGDPDWKACFNPLLAACDRDLAQMIASALDRIEKGWETQDIRRDSGNTSD